MRSIRCPAAVARVPLIIGLLCLPAAHPGAAAPASRELKTEAAQVAKHIEHAVAGMQPVVKRYGYVGVFGAVAVEGFGLPAPGQTLLMAGALEAALGKLHIVALVTLATAAAAVGNSIGYLLGRLGGRPLLRRLRVNEAREEKFEALFERYGGGIILLARFVDGPRQLNGIVAGTFGMHWWVFTVFNLVGAMLWVGVWGLGTYYLSEHLPAVELFLRRLNPWFVGLAVIAIPILIAYLFRGRRKRRAPSDPT